MADYMYLMAKLPYIGIFPPLSPVLINLDEYKEFEIKMKKSKIRKEYDEFIRNLEEEIFKTRKGENFTHKILNEHLITMNPYERETALLGIKWKFLENLSVTEPNKDWLWIYREKVDIINRFQLFETDKGIQKYHQFVEEVRENASQ